MNFLEDCMKLMFEGRTAPWFIGPLLTLQP